MKQTTVTWYTPEEKMPPEYESVLVTISGSYENVILDHVLAIAEWVNDGCGWMIIGLPGKAEYTVHAWCDLDPYGMTKEVNNNGHTEGTPSF